MSVLTIPNSGSKLYWSQPHNRVRKNREVNNSKDKNTLIFVSDFTSPADETSKLKSSKTEEQKAVKRGRLFSRTSENWIG